MHTHARCAGTCVLPLLAKPAFTERNFSVSFMLAVDRAYRCGEGDITLASKSLQRRCAILGQSRAGGWPGGGVGNAEAVNRPRKQRKALKKRGKCPCEVKHGIGSQGPKEV